MNDLDDNDNTYQMATETQPPCSAAAEGSWSMMNGGFRFGSWSETEAEGFRFVKTRTEVEMAMAKKRERMR